MAALIGLLTIIILSITVVRVGAIAFELTGLSGDVASFQAQSAFSGAGFTTSESETIVSHPVRRKIARILILLGSAGFSSSIATFILTFVGQTGRGVAIRVGVLVTGIVIIYLVARSRIVYNWMRRMITWALTEYTTLRVLDYEEVLGIGEGYMISRLRVRENSWMDGCPLKDLRLQLEGVLILSVHRYTDEGEKIIGIPQADTKIQRGDILICYGRGEALKNLSQRMKGKEGDIEHKKEARKERLYEEIREEDKDDQAG